MGHSKKLVEHAAALISEIMGEETGQLFYKFYELEGPEEVKDGARALLEEFMGSAEAAKKLKKLEHDS
jgi:hypothetical protein